jgi:hypothetical protein
MGQIAFILLGLAIFIGVAALFSVMSDPARVDKEEARRVGNPR